MKLLEICEKYYNEYGKEALNSFPDLLPYLCVGVCGSGSENFGYDDEYSLDHDAQAGFTIFIPDESKISSRQAFKLERAYNKLPKEFMGLKRQLISPVGGARLGVVRLEDFMFSKTGTKDGNLSEADFLNIPEFYLAEVTNGKIFYDGYGEFSKIRQKLAYMPENARLKKLAGNLILCYQAGVYNYDRILKRKDFEGAQLALYEYCKSAIKIIFLLNKKYLPFYKWQFKALRNLKKLNVADSLNFLISSDNENNSELKLQVISDINALIISELKTQNLTSSTCVDLEKIAYEVNDKITDSHIRNLNILYAVD